MIEEVAPRALGAAPLPCLALLGSRALGRIFGRLRVRVTFHLRDHQFQLGGVAGEKDAQLKPREALRFERM